MYRHCRLLSTADLNALAARAKDVSNTEARERLVEAVWPMIRKWAALRATRSEMDRADLEQEGALAALYACTVYDSSKAAFTTYLGYALKTYFHRHCRRMNRTHSLPLSWKTSEANSENEIVRRTRYAKPINAEMDEVYAPHEDPSEAIDRSEMLDKVMNYLAFDAPAQDRDVLLRRVRGERLWQIGAAFDRTKERIRQYETRAIQRAKMAMNKEN